MPDQLSIVREVKQALQQHFHDDIKEVILFGSRATGSAREDSDYDVLIILNKDTYDWKYRDQVFDVVYDLELQHDILVDTLLISIHELYHSPRGAQPLFTHALKEGVYA